MEHREHITEMIIGAVMENNGRDFYRQPLVGFSDPKDPLYRQVKETAGERHLDPEEILPEVRTVVSFFIPFSKSLVASNQARWKISQEWVESYSDCNRLIDSICSKVVDQFTAWGFQGATVSANGNYDPVRLEAGWSHRTAAYIAGLGSFGINQLLITKKGCSGRYGTVFTTEKLEPDRRPDKEYCILRRGGYCRSCVNRCPVFALTLDGYDRSTCCAQLRRNADQHPDLPNNNVCGKCAVGRCAILES